MDILSLSNATFPPKQEGVSRVIKAKNHMVYRSYNGQSLKVGDPVYQISFIQGSYTPILLLFHIIELIQDGRIKIKGEIQVGNTKNIGEQIIFPNQVHTDPLALLEHWLGILLHKANIELPTQLNGLKRLISEINPNYDFDKVVVGEGLQEEQEI